MITELTRAARDLRADRVRLECTMNRARLAALNALNAGATEVSVAAELGVDRNTIRKWRGKLGKS